VASGEMVGYFLGYKGRSFVREGRMYARIQPMTAKYGDRAIFFAVKPVPFEIAGLWAGAARYLIVRFLSPLPLRRLSESHSLASSVTEDANY